MNISGNSGAGFSERIATTSTRTQSTTEIGRTGSGNYSKRTDSSFSSDTLQLSNVAARIQSSTSSDTGRTTRLAAIAQAVQSNSYQVDPMRISKAMVSEAVGSKAG